MNQANAVWITGVGTATPLGHSYAVFANHLLEGSLRRRSRPGFRCLRASQSDRRPTPGSALSERNRSRGIWPFASTGAVDALVLHRGAARFRLVGASRRSAHRSGSRRRCGMAGTLGNGRLGGRSARLPAGTRYRIDDRSNAPRVGLEWTGRQCVGRLRQRQRRPLAGAPLAGIGLGGRVPGWSL